MDKMVFRSDLGIAMGGAGTDTAMETADFVLMADNVEKLPHTIQLSRKALQFIKQNIWFSSLIVKFYCLSFNLPRRVNIIDRCSK